VDLGRLAIYRCASIVGDTVHGVGSRKDFIGRVLCGVHRTGLIPPEFSCRNCHWDVVPVDYVSGVIVSLIGRLPRRARYRLNLCSRRLVSVSTLMRLMRSLELRTDASKPLGECTNSGVHFRQLDDYGDWLLRTSERSPLLLAPMLPFLRRRLPGVEASFPSESTASHLARLLPDSTATRVLALRTCTEERLLRFLAYLVEWQELD
jgi:thioester reductase-like protein